MQPSQQLPPPIMQPSQQPSTMIPPSSTPLYPISPFPSAEFNYQPPVISTPFPVISTLLYQVPSFPSAEFNYQPPVILSQSSYVNNIGSMHIVGEVLNQAPVTAKFVKIIATFYNANGQVIGTDFTYADPSDLAPGQRAPFDIIVLEGSVPMYQMSSYELTVDSQQPSFPSAEFNYQPPVILSQSSHINNIGSMHIVGEVLNQAPVTAKFVKIIATFYNANGQVIGTDFAYADPPDLAPGQRAPFDIIVLEGSVPMYQVSSYGLTVDSQAQSQRVILMSISHRQAETAALCIPIYAYHRRPPC